MKRQIQIQTSEQNLTSMGYRKTRQGDWVDDEGKVLSPLQWEGKEGVVMGLLDIG